MSRRFPGLFETHLKQFYFWAWVLIVPGYVLVTNWQDKLDALKRQKWAILMPPVLFGLYALKKAVEQHYAALEKVAAERGDATTELERRVRQLSETRTNQAHAVELARRCAQALTDLQTEGIAIRDDVTRTYVPSRHRAQIATWQDSVTVFLRRDLPDHLNGWLLPIPIARIRDRVSDSHQTVVNLDTQLNRIQTLVERIRQA